MNRVRAMKVIAERLRDELVVSSLGSASFDLAAVGDRPLNFYLWGGMGMALSVGLGLAQAQPGRRVLVVAGDGSLLMNLGALATVAAAAPRNLTCVVMDNGGYQLTGGQASATAGRTDIAAIARGAGIERAWVAADEATLRQQVGEALGGEGPALIVAKVSGESAGARPGKDPVALKYRFMGALGTVAPEMGGMG